MFCGEPCSTRAETSWSAHSLMGWRRACLCFHEMIGRQRSSSVRWILRVSQLTVTLPATSSSSSPELSRAWLSSPACAREEPRPRENTLRRDRDESCRSSSSSDRRGIWGSEDAKVESGYSSARGGSPSRCEGIERFRDRERGIFRGPYKLGLAECEFHDVRGLLERVLDETLTGDV